MQRYFSLESAPVANSYPPHRGFRLAGPIVEVNEWLETLAATAYTPSTGGPIHGVRLPWVSQHGPMAAIALPGRMVRIEAAISFGQGATLAVDSEGRVRPATGSQVIVARSLEAASAPGDVVWCVFEPQRPNGTW